MKKKAVVVKCKGTGSMSFEKLQNFQGKLKHMPDDNLAKLKASILNNGFRIPVFVWKNRIMDGHGRKLALDSLKKEGYSIPEIPVVELDADSETEARKLVLLINSRYGIISEEGFYDFAQELDMSDISGEVLIPEINLEQMEKEMEIEEKELSDGIETEHECPKCGYKW